jgi:L-arabinose transport system ATP-binding protein
VVVGRWLFEKPGLLLLDDPTQGIDVGAKADIYRELRELRAKGVAIVLNTSEMSELVSIADRVLVMAGGRVVAEFTGPEINPHNILEAASRG